MTPPQDGAVEIGARDAWPPALHGIVPELAAQLEDLLEKRGEILLAKQVRDLSAAESCLHKNGSDFYTAPRPSGAFGLGHRTIELIAGHLMVDVVMDRIVLIEVLHRRFLKVV